MRHELDGPANVSAHQHSDKTVTTIQAIETRAYGHRFRSRTEARWAVFFTTLGLQWEYEPEGFNIDGENYLPDFRVLTPQGEPIWYEVKPANVTTDSKLEKLRKALDHQRGDHWSAIRAVLLNGSPRDFFKNHNICPRCGVLLTADCFYDCGDEMGVVCFSCDMETPSGGGNPEENDGVKGISYYPHKGWVMTPIYEFEYLNRCCNHAVEAATSCRFEHGETP
jgi:hypothetical protein